VTSQIRTTGLFLLVAGASSACAPAPDSGGGVAIVVAPLQLDGLTDAEYTLSVEAGGETVWSRQVSSASYGDGAGSLSYVGPCDASVGTNTVIVELDALYAGGEIATDSYANPTPVSRDFQCVQDADVEVVFDITIARAAQQGFFDVAVELDDIFCSAKLDCVNSETGGDLELLHDPASGARDMTAVLGFACTSGVGGPTHLYMDDLQIDCTGWTEPTVVDVSGLGNVDLGAGTSANPNGYLFGASVWRGAEQLAAKAYWNVSLGLDETTFDVDGVGAGTCTLTATATATEAPLDVTVDGYALPADAVYPFIAWDVVLSDADGRVCTSHEVDQADSGVATTYVGYASTAPTTLRCARDVGTNDASCIDPGADGDLEVTGTFYVDAVSTSLTAVGAGADALTVADATGFGGGDEILLLTAQGADPARAGTWELARLAGVQGSTLELTSPLSEAFDPADAVIVQRVPNYRDVTVSGTLTAQAWNGTLGGLVALRASGTVTVTATGAITAGGLGFRGGAPGQSGGSSPIHVGQQGESYGVVSRPRTTAANLGAGGGGTYTCSGTGDVGGGGGGGGYAATGANGGGGYSGAGYGVGGQAYGAPTLERLYFGSGGGGGGADKTSGPGCSASSSEGGWGGTGARGGGVVLVLASEVIADGLIGSGGARGENSASPGNSGEDSGGGGGGAGGTVLIRADSTSFAAGVPSVPGGAGGYGASNGSNSTARSGGVGSDGRALVVPLNP